MAFLIPYVLSMY